MKKKQPRISETEWQIMETLWSEAPLSASEIHERIEPKTGCHVKTVRTLLDRLQTKGATDRKRVHGVWVFFPILDRESCLLAESKSFLERFFDADPVPLFVHLVENEVLSERDLEQLRAILDAETQGPNDDA